MGLLYRGPTVLELPRHPEETYEQARFIAFEEEFFPQISNFRIPSLRRDDVQTMLLKYYVMQGVAWFQSGVNRELVTL